MNYLKCFLKNPLQYLKNPRKTCATICSVIKGSKKYQIYLLKEHKRIYGFKNKEKTFYVICPYGSTQGLMSIHNYVLWKIRYAIEKGYIPVVDYKNFSNAYLESDLVGKVNAWEYYFCQPTQYGLEDIKHSRNVIICDKYLPAGYSGMEDESEILQFHEIINTYCKLNDKTEQKVKEVTDTLFPKNKKILGVLGRGTDYTSLQPSKHAKVPDIELLVKTVEEKMEQWGGYDYIFLATEDREIYDTLKSRFGDKLLAYDVPRFESDTKDKKLAELGFERENDRYLRGEEYLITIYLLAQCDSIITPVVGGGLAAVRINGGKYTHQFVFHLGEYV